MHYALQVFSEGQWRTIANLEPQAVLAFKPPEVLAFLLAATQGALAPTIAGEDVRIVELPAYKGARWR